VIESGDPWLTGIFLMAMKALRFYRGPLVSIFHSDPMITHITPWAERGRARFFRRIAERVAKFGFYTLQKGYDLTIVSSSLMERSLQARGIATTRMPFGVPEGFLDSPPPQRSEAGRGDAPIRLIYAGRLNPEKGLRLVLDSLPILLIDPRVHITVIGRGPLTPEFSAFQHPRYRFFGFVEGREEVLHLFDEHDILLAPGPYESFGLAALEGMARGLVVIGPDQGGTAELLRQAGSPFMFAAGDIEDFLSKVRLAVDADRRENRRRAREIAESYGTFGAAIERLVAFYITLAATQQPSVRRQGTEER
jgi:alpha-1,6-mannosyltransferase